MSDYYQQPDGSQNPQYGANQPYTPQPMTTSNQQYYTSQPYYQQPPAQPYQGSQQWPHMKIGEWMVTMLLMFIPIVNIILILMWAFGGNVNPSKKTFFQASLIYAAISFLLGILLSIAMWSIFAALFSSLFDAMPW